MGSGNEERVRVALDENFPEPLLAKLRELTPHVELTDVRRIDSRFKGLAPDWRVVLAVKQCGYQAFVTNDHHALDFPKTLVAIEDAGLTFVAIENAGHDPLVAVGALLLELPRVIRSFEPDRPTVYRWGPRAPQRKVPRDLLGELASTSVDANVTLDSLRRANAISEGDRLNPFDAARRRRGSR